MPAEADPAAFCAAELEIEAATVAESDPSAAIAEATATAPPDVASHLATVLAEVEANGGESEAFAVAYGDMIGWMKENCGFGAVEATATEYAFAGVPDEIAAGPTIISLTNLGEEYHEMLLMRMNDGVTESFDELMAMNDEEATFSKITVMSVAFAPNGAVGHAVADLTLGDYLAICFLPTGATPELMAQMSQALPRGRAAQPITGPETWPRRSSRRIGGVVRSPWRGARR